MSISHRIARPDHRHVMALALAQCHFIDPERVQDGEGDPVHGRDDIRLHDPFHGLDSQGPLSADIGDRTVDQPLQYPLLERFGVRTVGVVPATTLSGGWSPFTTRTAVAFGANLDPDRAAKDRQVPQSNRPIIAVKPIKLLTTAVALGRW